MDSRGWIAISLLGSFNRVKSLTYDLQLVKDVLILSSLVEVQGDWVRMHRWERYVLPDAPPSPLETDRAVLAAHSDPVNVGEAIPAVPYTGDSVGSQHDAAGEPQGHYAHSYSYGTPEGPVQSPGQHEGEDDEELEGEEEDEDDVEFVLGGDMSESWTSERKPEV